MSHKPSPAAILFANINPNEARGVIAKRLKSFEPDVQYTTAQLRDKIKKLSPGKDFSKSDIYDWRSDNIDVYKDGNTDKLRGFADSFSIEDIEKILMAHYLWENGADRKHIAGAVRFWSQTGEIEKKEFEIDIVERKRARLMLAGRFLGIIVGLITDLDGPPLDSILICREVPDGEKPLSNLELGTLTSPPEIVNVRTLVGYVKNIPEAEILIGIEDFSQFIPLMVDRQYYSIRIQDEDYVPNQVELIIGLRNGVLDRRGELFLSRHKLGHIGKNEEKTKTAYKMLKYVFEKFFLLDQLFESADFRFHNMRGSDQLSAMTSAVVLANENWSSCIFWTKEGDNHLTARGYSPGFTGDANKILTLSESLNLESFVYKGNGSIVCDDTTDWKRRLPKEDNHITPVHFAIVPAVSRAGIEGVLCVNAEQDSTYNFNADLDLLKVFGRVLAETYAREKIADVSHLLSLSLLETREWNDESVLTSRIASLLMEEKQRQTIERWDDIVLDEYVLLYMLKIDVNGSRSIKRWYDTLFSQHLRNLLNEKLGLISDGVKVHSLYRFNPGEVIFLIPKIKIASRSNFDDLQEQLIATLSGFIDGYSEARVAIWPVYFPYSLLVSKMKERGPSDLEEHDLASIGKELIIETTKNLFPMTHLLMDAEHRINDLDYQNALSGLTEALSRDITPGGNPFIYRRLSDAYGGLDDWTSSLNAAKDAIAAEEEAGQPYAGSYLRVAKAQEHLNQSTQALDAYQKAAELSPEPLYQLEYARALTLYGNNKSQYETANGVLIGLRAITELPSEQKAFVAYVQSLLQKNRGKSRDEQLNTLDIAARFDKINPYISLEKDLIRLEKNNRK